MTETHKPNKNDELKQHVESKDPLQIRNKTREIKGEGSLKLWKYRPFSRVVKGWKAYQIVRHYIQINEKEANREIRYRKERLKGLSLAEWQLLWS